MAVTFASASRLARSMSPVIQHDAVWIGMRDAKSIQHAIIKAHPERMKRIMICRYIIVTSVDNFK